MRIGNLQKIWWKEAQPPQLPACWTRHDFHCAINPLSLTWILAWFNIVSFLHIWDVFYKTWRTKYMFMFHDSIFLQGHLPSDVKKIIVNVYVGSNCILELFEIHCINMRDIVSFPNIFNLTTHLQRKKCHILAWQDYVNDRAAQDNHSHKIHGVNIKFYAS
jgi:hypothetical protein